MKKILLSLGLWLGLCAGASAQCIGVGGINNVPQPGMVCPSESILDTYGATSVGLVPAASATDIACLTGSATKIVRVQSVTIAGTGTATAFPVLLTKNLTADTGGTLATSTALPVPFRFDSTSPAPSATTQAWTANPTITGTAGILDSGLLGIAATTVTVNNQIVFDYFSRITSMAPILRGIAQQLCVNLNATSPTALLTISFRWTEAPQ